MGHANGNVENKQEGKDYEPPEKSPVTSAPSINDYKLKEIIGEGSFSIVYRAIHKVTNHEVAIKVISKKQIIKENKVKYASIERQVYSITSHPTILKLYFTSQDSGSLYYALEYIPNQNLEHYLSVCGNFALDVSIFYFAEITSGVKYLHSQGIIHRDLKPNNILVSSDFHIKICDFGSAALGVVEDAKDTEIKTNTRHSFVGTADYCSFELLKDKYTCLKSDIWSMGCILYEFVTGTPPFRAPTDYLIFRNITNIDYCIPNWVDPLVSSVLESIFVPPEKRVDIYKINASPLFSTIDWENLHTIIPPTFKSGYSGPQKLKERSNFMSIFKKFRISPIFKNAQKKKQFRKFKWAPRFCFRK